MNQHIIKAREYIARGEEFYRKAAEEISAAREIGLTWAKITKDLGRSEDWCRALVANHKSPEDTRPFGLEADPTQRERNAKAIAKKPEGAAAIVADPEARREIGRALDEHYTEQAKKSAARVRAKDVERKGGEDEYVEHQRRQHVVEVVSVARGATSGWRFVASQVKSLDLDSGAAEELEELASETEGFLSLFRSVLAGEEIADSDLAELLKEEV